MRPDYDAVVVGAGPNGLAAAATMARGGCSVLLIERADRVGGGTRSEALTLPGFLHDVCSSIHPMAVASPVFTDLSLEDAGLRWIRPPVSFAHPFDDGTAAAQTGTVEDTARTLGRDGEAYRRLFGRMAEAWNRIRPAILGSLIRWPRHPVAVGRFGFDALRSARGLAEGWFAERDARALFAGAAAHSTLPLERCASAAVGLLLSTVGHIEGWPLPRGGSQAIADALAKRFEALGGRIEVGRQVSSFGELPEARAYLFDVTPGQLATIADSELPKRYVERLLRFRHGPGVFKVDWALSEPIPWTAEACRLAGTVHLGGTLDEVSAAEAAVWRGEYPSHPFVLLTQPSLFDSDRAPAGSHTAWGYCHVPLGSTTEMTRAIESQVERFAPGFRETIRARHVMTPSDLEARNPNLRGGDIGGGSQNLFQTLFRPTVSLNPYQTPNARIFLCSSSTPPGGGVHGMCGHNAAKVALARIS